MLSGYRYVLAVAIVIENTLIDNDGSFLVALWFVGEGMRHWSAAKNNPKIFTIYENGYNLFIEV